jgi:hypothetical protein
MITLKFKDDTLYLVPGALAWLRETERILNEDLQKKQVEFAAFGSVSVKEVQP